MMEIRFDWHIRQWHTKISFFQPLYSMTTAKEEFRSFFGGDLRPKNITSSLRDAETLSC